VHTRILVYIIDRVHAVRIGTYPRVTDLNQELQGSALNYGVKPDPYLIIGSADNKQKRFRVFLAGAFLMQIYLTPVYRAYRFSKNLSSKEKM
jgi:hypothetical protein